MSGRYLREVTLCSKGLRSHDLMRAALVVDHDVLLGVDLRPDIGLSAGRL